MISTYHLIDRTKHYLADPNDIVKIENYEVAINDPNEIWVCHHRRELEPDRKTMKELEALGLYWYQPPEALIFLTPREHARLHCTKSNPMLGKSSWDGFSEEEKARRKARYSETMKGRNKNKKHYHDSTGKRYFCSEDDIRIKEFNLIPGLGPRGHEPEKSTGYVRWNNGIQELKRRECPGEGWVRGGLKR